MSLFEELKRRKVFKVGAAYAVVAWLVIQVAATVAPQLGLPEWAPRLITLIALLGFPVAIVLAWMLDYSSEGIRVELAGFGHKRVFTAAAILAALALGWFLRGGVPGGAGKPEETAALGEKSTAVLPFVNMSADKDNEYFSDGLTENLLHKLAQVNEIKVAARTSSFAFKGKQEDIRQIGRALGVATVVEGSVQRAGDTLRITAQLVRTADGSHVWSQRYDRKLADLFAIQDEIAGAVAEALVGALVPEAKAAIAHGGTTNLAAYDLYTRGLQQHAHYNFDSLTQAERLFQQALAADPKYVDAMLALLWNWDRMQITGMITQAELVARATPWLDRIEALDQGSGAVLGFRARFAAGRGERDEARQLYLRAVASAPNDAALGLSYVQFLRAQDEQPAALEQLDRVLRLDAANSTLYVTRSRILRSLDRYDEATGAAKRAIELDPQQPNAYGALAELADRTGDPVGQAIWLMKGRKVDPRDHEIPTNIAGIMNKLGEHAAADAWIEDALRIAPGHIFVQAESVDQLLLRGDRQAALDRGLAFIPRESENVRGSWLNSLSDACIAGALLGRGAEVRARLEQAGVMPRELTASAFRALDATHVSLANRIEGTQGFLPCLLGTGGDDAARKRDLRDAYAEILGADWAKPQWMWFVDGYLRGDRERSIGGLMSRPGRERELENPGWIELAAHFGGVADDPRVKARIAGLREKLAAARAALPQRLREEGLTLVP